MALSRPHFLREKSTNGDDLYIGKNENDGRKSTIVSSLYFILLQQYFPAKEGGLNIPGKVLTDLFLNCFWRCFQIRV